MDKQPILVIVGPTAVGKTELSLEIAEILGAEIIAADSMQVYQGMDIGTAKAGPQEQKRVPHHLLDVVRPHVSFNVADYVSLAAQTLQDLKRRGVTPLLTGGSGLYIDALIDGFLFPDSKADPKLRAQLEKKGRADPVALFSELKKADPQSAKRIHPHDLRRTVRALEVYYRTGKPISKLQQKRPQRARPYLPLFIGLTRNRSQLYQRIDQRVEAMIQKGLVQEVQDLLTAYPQQPTALQALGYKEIALYLNGGLSWEEAVHILKRDTRRYAKRQLSWFRRNQRIHWFNLSLVTREQVVQEVCQLWKAAF